MNGRVIEIKISKLNGTDKRWSFIRKFTHCDRNFYQTWKRSA